MTTRLHPDRALRRNKTDGFSLIEMLVSALIFTIMVIGYTALFHYSLLSWNDAAARLERSVGLGGTMERMLFELHSTLPILTDHSSPRFIGYNTGAGHPLTNSIADEIMTHVAISSPNEGTPGVDPVNDINAIQYWLKSDGMTFMRGNQASRRSNVAVSLPQGALSQGIIGTRAQNLQFDFWNGVGWVTAFNSATDSKLPELVRITAVVRQFGKSDTVQFIIRPMARGNAITL
jgi:prepilin-type N-terminal cleavage/methylation domain-containing protein